MANKILQYVDRTDVDDNFEDKIRQKLEVENHIIVGFPGIGKSTTAKSILARHIENKGSGVYLKINRSIKDFDSTLELVSINNRNYLIPIVQVPFNSTEQKEVLSSITDSLKNLSKTVEKISKMLSKLENIEDYKKLFIDEKDTFIKILGESFPHIEEIIKNAKQVNEVLGYVKIIAESLPYVSLIVKICDGILKLKEKYDIRIV